MSNVRFDIIGPLGLAAMLLIFGTFFLTLYLVSREKRKLMMAIGFLIIPLGYFDMALDFLPYSAYRRWSHLPFLFALAIAVSERLLPEKLDFSRLFRIFLIFTFLSFLLVPIRILGLERIAFLSIMVLSTLLSLFILICMIIQIIKFKDPIVIVGVPGIGLLLLGGLFVALDIRDVFIMSHIFAFIFLLILLLYASTFKGGLGKRMTGYFSLNEQLRETREDLERTAKKFELTFDNAKEAIIWTNKQGRVINYNRSAMILFEPVHLKGIDLPSLFTNESSSITDSRLRRDIRDRNEFEGEFEIKIGKKKFPVMITAASTEFNDELITQFIISDISSRKMYENTLKEFNTKMIKVNEELKHSDRIKSEFISILSHDIINPLIAVKGKLQLMQEGLFGETTEPQRETIEGMIGNLDRINDIRRDTLALSKLESGPIEMDPEPVDLGSIVRSSLEIVASSPYSKEHSIIMEDIPKVELRCNSKLMERALENYLSNAVRYSPPGSQVRMGAYVSSGFVRVFVADQGRGLPHDELERIFDRFYRTGERVKGSTGLGLSIVMDIAKAHNGKAWAESSGPGEGSIFHFSIPISGSS